jgi:hypothetical protein
VAEMIHEHHTHLRTAEGITYVPRTIAERQADGSWEAWLEFRPLHGNAPVLRTERETGQATREAVVAWALGLEAIYFEGAFERAQFAGSRA